MAGPGARPRTPRYPPAKPPRCPVCPLPRPACPTPVPPLSRPATPVRGRRAIRDIDRMSLIGAKDLVVKCPAL